MGDRMTAHEATDTAADSIEEGLRLIGEGDYSGAEAAFHKAVSLEPGDYHTHGNLGFALVKLRRYAEAEAAYQTAIRLNPDDPWPHSNLGHLLGRSSP
jgi:Flp pilus assembly protein TadD